MAVCGTYYSAEASWYAFTDLRNFATGSEVGSAGADEPEADEVAVLPLTDAGFYSTAVSIASRRELTGITAYRDHAIKNEIDLLEPRNLPGQRLGGLTLRSTLGFLLGEPSPVRRSQPDFAVFSRTVNVRNDRGAHRFLQTRGEG